MRFDSPELWAKWRTEYLNFLNEELEVDTALDYVSEFGNENVDEDEVLEDLLKEIGEDLLAFERVYPMMDQDVAIVFINPGLNWWGDVGDDYKRVRDDNFLMSKQGWEDWSHRTAISMDGGSTWLSKEERETVRSIIDDIGDVTGLLTDRATEPERSGSFFAHIYYTNWYKFATKEADDIPSEIKSPNSFVSEILRAELEHIDPKIVVSFGRLPWENGFYSYVDPVTDAPISRNITDVENHVYRYNSSDTEYHVLPFAFPAYAPPDYQRDKLREGLNQVF